MSVSTVTVVVSTSVTTTREVTAVSVTQAIRPQGTMLPGVQVQCSIFDITPLLVDSAILYLIQVAFPSPLTYISLTLRVLL